MQSPRLSLRTDRGFTLIELLTVIAIIGILAAIIIPTTGAVRKAAKNAQTKGQFSNWVTSMTLYKQEYGFFPPVNRSAYGTSKVNLLDSDGFAIALTGRKLNGGDPGTTTAELFGNKKRLSFYALSNKDLNDNRDTVIDAFENTEIAVIYDKNADGMITTADLDSGTNPPTVKSFIAATGMTSTDGPRASVIFYSAGRGNGVEDIVYSWK